MAINQITPASGAGILHIPTERRPSGRLQRFWSPAMSHMIPATSIAAASPPAVILFGRDERQRPHASCFASAEIAAAERAAVLMGMHVLTVCNDAHRSLAESLPRGRIFKSNKAFVPFVKLGIFDQLLAAAGQPNAPMPVRAAGKPAGTPPVGKGGHGGTDAPGGAGGASKPPFDWADITIGSLVLATTGGPQEGWFEAVVRYTKADAHFVLAWRDWPLEPEFSRQRNDLALLHPGTATVESEA
ncbi:hypothetical protein MKK70_27310 [Methylobacterium sp. E-041]|uniref:hypothetical protein n=1 Tax=Methylobacterium sp. E-041 TaxID=2836573 RepID=UPI001FBAEBDC|nr:hypothetical protein [Methylobacterium sp. E-041]MCJ2109010.1 hypothetical protein [Methylobacterium sp. E-041]